MGVIVKGMKMPESCWMCNFCHEVKHYGNTINYCSAQKNKIILPNRSERDEICPLVEIPPHGRLIDADALSERIEEQRNTEYAMKNKPHGSWRRVLELSLNMISDAPTIIEGEAGT